MLIPELQRRICAAVLRAGARHDWPRSRQLAKVAGRLNHWRAHGQTTIDPRTLRDWREW